MTAQTVKTSHVTTPLLIAGVSLFLVISFVTGLKQMPGYINDEAVEVLQSRDLPFDRYYVFAPAYHGGEVDIIESTVPYLVHFSEALLGQGLASIRLVYFASLCIGIWLFSRIANRLAGPVAGNLALVMSATSSYVLFYNRIVTRNGVSFLLTVLLITILVRIVDSQREQPFNYWLLAGLPSVCILSILTYSSYKIIVTALYLVLIGYALFVAPRWKRLVAVLSSVVITFLGLVLLAWLSDTPFAAIILRGDYVINHYKPDVASIFKNLFFSILMPFIHQNDGAFFRDITHDVFGRHSMSWWIAPFLVYGIVCIFRGTSSIWETGRRNVLVACRVILLVWFLSLAFLSVGGPSLKHFYATFPFILLFAVLGLERMYRQMRNHPLALVLLIGLCSLSIISECYHLIGVISPSQALALEVQHPRRVAAAVSVIANEGPIILAEDFAKDAVRLHTRDFPSIRYLPYNNVISPSFLFALLARQPLRIISFDVSHPALFATYPDLLACFTITEAIQDGMKYKQYEWSEACGLGWADWIF